MDAVGPRANVPGFDWSEADLLRSPRVAIYRTMKAMTPNGAYGEPAAATAAKGRQITDVVCAALSQVIRDLAR